MRAAATKELYCIPSAYAEARVSLDEFSRQDIVEYLAYLDGEDVTAATSEGNLTISSFDMDRISTLLLCGQREPAREFLFEIVGRHIGRTL